MITTKFTIGQQVRHKMLGFLGVIVDVDPEYSLDSDINDMMANESMRAIPWYHVVVEDRDGRPVQTYLAEVQLDSERQTEHPEQLALDELSASIRQQLKEPCSRH